MLQKLLLQDQEAKSVIEGVKDIKIKDVVYMCADAWDNIPAETLTRSWNKLLASEKTTDSDKQPEGTDAQG